MKSEKNEICGFVRWRNNEYMRWLCREIAGGGPSTATTARRSSLLPEYLKNRLNEG